jgi:hypothetical protein
MAMWPGLRQITGVDIAFKTFKMMQEFIEPYITDHQKSLDPDNIRDFVDLMLVEVQNTDDPNSSFHGKTGNCLKLERKNDFIVLGLVSHSHVRSFYLGM